MDDDFFVMLNTQDGGYTPMIGDDDNMAKFETAEQAKEAAKNSVLGEVFGYEVFEIGEGVY